MTARHDCPLCGESTRAGLATCLPCAGMDADGLVFVKPSLERQEGSLASRLRATVARDVGGEALALAGGGHRAVAAVPMAAAETVAKGFEELGIPVRVVSGAQAMGKLPTGVTLALGVMALAGAAAGFLAAPTYLVLTPVMAALILVLAQARLRTPIVPPRSKLSLVGSTDAARSVARRLAALEPGPARSLLSRIAGLARVMEKRVGSLDDPAAMDNLRVLVKSAAPVAAELERVCSLRRILDDPELEVDPSHERAVTDVDRAIARLEGALSGAADVLQRSSRWDADTLRQAAELPRLAEKIEARLEAWDQALEAVDHLVEDG